MSFLFHKIRPSNPTARAVFFFLLVSLALVGILTRVEWAARGVQTVQAFLFSQGVRLTSFWDMAFRDRKILWEEKERAEFLAIQTHLDASRLFRLQQENESLRALLEEKSAVSIPLLSARLMSRTLPEDRDLFLLDRGREDGVSVGDVVIAAGGVYVGSIVRTSAFTSVVQRLTDSQSRIAIRRFEDRDPIGIAQGNGGAFLSVSFLPASLSLQPGDVFMTTLLDPLIPPDLLVGVVQSVTRDPREPFQEAFLEPLLDFSALRIVGIYLLGFSST